MAVVYLLHFDTAYWNKCQHYLGYAKDLVQRMRRHRAGTGSKLVDYALRQGREFEIVMTKEYETCAEAKAEERRLKKTGHYKRFCPICQE